MEFRFCMSYYKIIRKGMSEDESLIQKYKK